MVSDCDSTGDLTVAAVCCDAECRARDMRRWCSGQRTLAVNQSDPSREIGTVLIVKDGLGADARILGLS